MKRSPDLRAFLSACFLDADPAADPSADAAIARAWGASAPSDRRRLVATQARRLLDGEFPALEDLGTETNRWFGDPDEARAWLTGILDAVASSAPAEGEAEAAVVVRDSLGTALSEGDSVQVIKDLKVKGGASDLKRGTIIRKIHLIGDAEAIECRVDGGTLVLKTCFLKKA